MSETLIIENLGPIKHAELDLKRAMAFIGPQSSGKSVIAKVITIFRGFEILTNLEGSSTDNLDINFLLKQYSLEDFIKKNTVIRYNASNYEFSFHDSKAHFKIKQSSNYYKAQKEESDFKRENGINDLIDIANEMSILEKDVLELVQKVNKMPEGQEKDDFLEKFVDYQRKYTFKKNILNEGIRLSGNIGSEILKLTSYSSYIPSERSFISIAAGSFLSLANNNVSLPKNLLEFGEMYEKARDNIKEFTVDFLGVTYRYENKEDRIYMDSNIYVNMKSSSSGLQSALPLMLVVDHSHRAVFTGHTYVIEEPEQSLYPEAQNKLVYYLADKCLYINPEMGLQNELVITTHSPYVLTSLNNLLFAYSVAKKYPELKQECEKVIPSASWIDPDEFNAYYVGDGTVRGIMNRETNLIDGNELDSASEIIMGDFDELMDLYRHVNA